MVCFSVTYFSLPLFIALVIPASFHAGSLRKRYSANLLGSDKRMHPWLNARVLSLNKLFEGVSCK